jgi:hypothetical protein
MYLNYSFNSMLEIGPPKYFKSLPSSKIIPFTLALIIVWFLLAARHLSYFRIDSYHRKTLFKLEIPFFLLLLKVTYYRSTFRY